MSLQIEKKAYEKKAAFLRVSGIVQNPQNMRQIPFSFTCRVDTGFDGGITTPQTYRSDVQIIGIQPSLKNWTLANGKKVTVYICAAYIQQIDTCRFPMPGIPVKLVMLGHSEKHFLGMDSLKHCLISFDGKNQNFSLVF